MLRRAARKHGLNLSASWMVGDIEADVEAGRRADARTVLVGPETSATPPDHRAENFADAVRHILESSADTSDSGQSAASLRS
jgi:D-glycero-D-manno-heptose 1,7-bisphosphate phosphatase